MRRFGQFAFDRDQRRLSREGQPVHLTPKAFDLLMLLVDAAPRVLTKSELHAALWPSSFVADVTLTGLVKELRRALDDRDRDSPVIRTVHRVGYAFCASLDQASAAANALCGWLVIGDQRLPVTCGEHVVGRDPAVAIWIDHDTISRQHARLVVTAAGDARVDDLGSKNGTWIGAARIAPSALLRDGDAIRFGQVTAIWRVPAALAPTRTQAAQSRTRDPRS